MVVFRGINLEYFNKKIFLRIKETNLFQNGILIMKNLLYFSLVDLHHGKVKKCLLKL